MTWKKFAAGRYWTKVGGAEYEARKHDGLTWQDPAYWTLSVNGEYVTQYNGWAKRFRTLADAKRFVAEDCPMPVNKVSAARLSPYDKSVIINALHSAIAHETNAKHVEKFQKVLEKVSA